MGGPPQHYKIFFLLSDLDKILYKTSLLELIKKIHKLKLGSLQGGNEPKPLALNYKLSTL